MRRRSVAPALAGRDGVVEHAARAARWREQAEQDFEKRRFAGPVWAEQADAAGGRGGRLTSRRARWLPYQRETRSN